MSSNFTPEQDAETRQIIVIGDYPSDVRERLATLLRPHGITVSAADTMVALDERLRGLAALAEAPPLSLPLPPLPPLVPDASTQPNRAMRRRAEKVRRRYGAK